MPVALAGIKAVPEGGGEHEGADEAGKPVAGALCRSAAVACGNKQFQDFVIDQCSAAVAELSIGELHQLETDTKFRTNFAADFVRSYCCVQSRRELDLNSEAKRLYASIMSDYREWIEAHGHQ